MKEEIKEILDNTLEYLEGIDETRNTKILTTNEINILLDYITNLQEKCENYRKLKERYQIEKELYKQRNEKAIEYIEKTMRIDDEYPDYMEMEICEYQELLNILKGDKDE